MLYILCLLYHSHIELPHHSTYHKYPKSLPPTITPLGLNLFIVLVLYFPDGCVIVKCTVQLVPWNVADLKMYLPDSHTWHHPNPNNKCKISRPCPLSFPSRLLISQPRLQSYPSGTTSWFIAPVYWSVGLTAQYAVPITPQGYIAGGKRWNHSNFPCRVFIFFLFFKW